MMRLADLVSQFDRVELATVADNQRILSFIDDIAMQTKEGGLGIDRNPSFFSLGKAQGDHSFTFLFLNPNNSIGGIGCISITCMQVKGKKQWLGYCSDLKFTRKIDPETRRQFYKFFERLINEFSNIEELQSCRYILASIFDGNIAAKKALIAKKTKKNQVEHRPLYSYENVNILMRLPFPRLKKQSFVKGSAVGKERIIEFLTSNPENAEIVWTRQEIERRQKIANFSFDDFIVKLDNDDTIVACGLLLSDSPFRKMRIHRMPKSIKLTQYFTPVFGRPTIKEKAPLKIAYLSFLKMKTQEADERSHLIDGFLAEIYSEEKQKARNERFHIVNIQEPKQNHLGKSLTRKGYLCNSLPSTIYQVTTREPDATALVPGQQRLDFDVVFH